MKPKPKKELRRVDIGLAVYGGTGHPIGAHLLYRIDWDDGTSTIERGLTVGTMAGQAHAVRPDLQPHMLAIQALLSPIREAAWAADDPPKPKRKKPKPRLAPGDGCPRRPRRPRFRRG